MLYYIKDTNLMIILIDKKREVQVFKFLCKTEIYDLYYNKKRYEEGKKYPYDIKR